MIERLGPELPILESLPIDAIRESGFPEVADAIDLVRRGQVELDPGSDGEYGAVHLPRLPAPQ
jgi:PHP family Zn ribbon phosphoesterase